MFFCLNPRASLNPNPQHCPADVVVNEGPLQCLVRSSNLNIGGGLCMRNPQRSLADPIACHYISLFISQ
eukprot:4035180-Amphidinium_carterae.1